MVPSGRAIGLLRTASASSSHCFAEPPAFREGAVRAGLIAEPEELLELLLRRDPVGADLLPARPQLRVEDTVDDEGPYSVREEVGVGGAQERAVGEAEVGELGIAHGSAQEVEVSSDIGGVHVRCDSGALGQALRPEGVVGVEERAELRLLVGKDRHVGEVAVERPLALEASERIGCAHAPRVEPDDVEAPAQVASQELAEAGQHELDAGATGPARVDEDRATLAALVRCRDLRQRDRSGRALRVAVVQRNLGGGAQGAREVAAAGLPVQRWRPVRLRRRLCADRSRRRDGDRRHARDRADDDRKPCLAPHDEPPSSSGLYIASRGRRAREGRPSPPSPEGQIVLTALP